LVFTTAYEYTAVRASLNPSQSRSPAINQRGGYGEIEINAEVGENGRAIQPQLVPSRTE
jgi:hypothetical protein